jgi:hypothetical protein
MEQEQGIERLRSLIMDYVICHVEAIVKEKKRNAMLQELGALAKDLFLKSLRRLDWQEGFGRLRPSQRGGEGRGEGGGRGE